MQTDPATLNRLAAECMEPMPTEPPKDGRRRSPMRCWEWVEWTKRDGLDNPHWHLRFDPAHSEYYAVRFAEWFKRGPGKGCVVAFEWDGIEGTDTAAIQVMDSYGRTDMEHTVTTGPFPLALTTAILTALGKLEQSND